MKDMKTNSSRMWQHLLLPVLALFVSMSLLQPLSAKVVITNYSKPVVLKKGSKGGSSSTSQSTEHSHLNCEGYDTYITANAKGETEVYVNDHTAPSSREEIHQAHYLVDTNIKDYPYSIDWAYYYIMANGTTSSSSWPPYVSHPVNITMDGGEVNSIYLCTNNIDGLVSLTVTGGKINYIGDASNNTHSESYGSSVYLDNMTYTGSKGIDYYNIKSLFVGSSCKFVYEEAAITSFRISDAKVNGKLENALYLLGQQMYAFGTITVREGTVLNAKALQAPQGTKIINNGTIVLSDCDGLANFKGTITGNQPVVTAHVEEEECLAVEDCEHAGSYQTRCRVCGNVVKTAYERAALGHVAVTDKAVAATCIATGLTAGSHCQRCDKVLVAQTEVTALGHNMQAWETATEASCTGTGSQKRSCSRCDYTETQGTNATGHTFGEWTTTQEPDCEGTGLQVRVCTICHEASETQTLAALGHRDFIHHDRVEPTCEEKGMTDYYECGVCHQLKYLNLPGSADNIADLSCFVIPALGHQFSKEEIGMEDCNLVHPANCLEPALYHKLCRRCDAIAEDDDLTFTVGKALDHEYYIAHIDSISAEYAESGELTIACHRCDEEWPHFEFDVMRAQGTDVQGEQLNGYWCTSKLDKVLERPTCLPGKGLYAVSINFYGQLINAQYQNFIPPVADLHNWDPADGICKEKHYKYVTDEYGNVKTDKNGNMEYELDAYNHLIEDNTVYAAKARLTYTTDLPYYDAEGKAMVDRYGDPMSYREEVTRAFDNVDDALDAAVGSSELATLFLYTDVKLEDEKTFDNFNPLDIDLNGHVFDASYDRYPEDHFDNALNQWVYDYTATPTLDYRELRIAHDMIIRNGTLKANLLNWSDRNTLLFDGATVYCRSIAWGAARSNVNLTNGSKVFVGESYFYSGMTYIDETSELHITGYYSTRDNPGQERCLQHYFRHLHNPEDGKNYALDDTEFTTPLETLHFYGRNRTPHIMDYYVDAGVGYNNEGFEVFFHYLACRLCGYCNDENLTKDEVLNQLGEPHTPDADGKCTKCGHCVSEVSVESVYDTNWYENLTKRMCKCPQCDESVPDNSVLPIYEGVFTLNNYNTLPDNKQLIVRGMRYERMVKPGSIVTLSLPAAVPMSNIHGSLYVLGGYTEEGGLTLRSALRVPGMIDADGCIVPGVPYFVLVDEAEDEEIALIEEVNEDILIDTDMSQMTIEAGSVQLSGNYIAYNQFNSDLSISYYQNYTDTDGFAYQEYVNIARYEGLLSFGLSSEFIPIGLTLPDWQSDNQENHSTDSESDEATYTFTLSQAAVISFDWVVSSEENCDYLTVEAIAQSDDELRSYTVLDAQSGEDNGTARARLPKGTYYLKLCYHKDFSVSAGQDMAWVSNIAFSKLSQEPPVNLPYTIAMLRTINDGEAYSQSNAVSNIDVLYTRTFDNDHFNALYVPFPMQYSDWSEVADVYELRNIYEVDENEDGQIDAWTLRVLRLGEGSSTEANMPYLIRPKEQGDIELIVEGTTLAPASEADEVWCASTQYRFDFRGTYNPFELPADQYYFMSTTGGLQYNDLEATLRPQRWYMAVSDKRKGTLVNPSTLESTSSARFRIVTDDDATCIEQLHTLDAEATAFDLMGRRLSKSDKGLHIINNNKVMRF